ncbi:alpha-1,2-mannosyltransferase [Coprinopsis sp. MPI-PUGE-AT-0042]|nr:alpha-1,2-mannosyltransferase [Coprinopsis sp. MPI-PUGE-AT-0042]
MNTRARYVLLALALVVALHYLLSLTHEVYGNATSLSDIRQRIWRPPSGSVTTHEEDTLATTKRVNASFVILCRNEDLEGIIRSIKQIEARFNHQYRYPYVFLNDVPFTDEFQRRLSNISPAKMEFGTIPHDHWNQPDWIDEDRAKANRDKMVKQLVIYGGSVSYRNMCRFNSGFFFRHPLMLKYRWYWRIEPSVTFHCDVNEDPFLFMEQNNKTYGFNIVIPENRNSIPTLWDTVQDFIKEHPEHIADDNALNLMINQVGRYNGCHFWSNFEIADMDFWRSPAYMAFFEYLESKGGFYYERWGDAPVHSLAAAMFLNKNQIHYFDEIGYEHTPYVACPQRNGNWESGRCSCDNKRKHWGTASCMGNWLKMMNMEL